MSATNATNVASSASAPAPRATFALWVRTGVAHPTRDERAAVDSASVAALKLTETHVRRQRALKAWKLARKSKWTSNWCQNDELCLTTLLVKAAEQAEGGGEEAEEGSGE